jgi:hypothetical protein
MTVQHTTIVKNVIPKIINKLLGEGVSRVVISAQAQVGHLLGEIESCLHFEFSKSKEHLLRVEKELARNKHSVNLYKICLSLVRRQELPRYALPPVQAPRDSIMNHSFAMAHSQGLKDIHGEDAIMSHELPQMASSFTLEAMMEESMVLFMPQPRDIWVNSLTSVATLTHLIEEHVRFLISGLPSYKVLRLISTSQMPSIPEIIKQALAQFATIISRVDTVSCQRGPTALTVFKVTFS